MSSRQLRKIQQQRELAQASVATAKDSGGESADDEPIVSKPRQNLFAAFGDTDGDENRDDDDEDEGHGEARKEEEMPQNLTTKKTKKKKQKKKSKTKASGGSPEREVERGNGDEEDEIDKAIAELRNSSPMPSLQAQNPANEPASRMSVLLSVSTRHLRAVNEMRSLFGRDVIDSANAEEQQQAGARRRGGEQQEVDLETFLRSAPGALKIPETLLRRNVFVQGRDHWPRESAGGLTMTEVEKAPDESWTEYTFAHDKNYDVVQQQFFYAVLSGQPMNLVYSLKRNPYHVSTLLQVSSIAKQDQNMALAAELCERALFTFGRVTTSAFRQDMERGRARLDFRRPENRQFWLAGYHYLKSLVRKGTYRTALEWARLLYALDPKDPFAMRHLIHSLAIRAFEARWLVDFLDSIDLEADNRDVVYLRQTVVLAKLQLGDEAGARECLAQGIKRLPWLYCAMFQELNLDAPPSIWGISADSDSRAFWVKLYLYQTKDLWDNAQATTLLQGVAKGLERVDITALPHDDPPADLGVARLAYLENETSLLAAVPRTLLESQPNFDFDPLPPPEAENIFTGQGTQLPWGRGLRNEAAGRDIRNQGPLRNPWGHLGPQNDPGLAPLGMFGQEEDDEDDEVRALRQADDEELQRDLEAYASRANEPGMLGALMRMLGIAGRDEGGTEGGREENASTQHDGDTDGLPGAWPTEGHGSDEAGTDDRTRSD
ncbi:hypothetical protein HIM_00026 [Hirsutella minnesotensis 3608]|nr:hypothetical protein HIM_00026 [Hirsutella minnesotensis 3608]